MSLEALKPRLWAIDGGQVRVPSVPIATALQEAHELKCFTAEPEIHCALLAVGLPEDFNEELERRIDAAREAQSAWVAERDRNRSRERVRAEADAVAARRRMIAAGRYNLHGDEEAQAALSAISGGAGVADLVQALHDLAELAERHGPAFDADRSFDVSAEARSARELAKQLSIHVSEERLTLPHGARELRDRAFSYLYELVSRVRHAGRYVFRKDRDTRRRFGSRYRRRVDRRGRRGMLDAEFNDGVGRGV